MLRSRRARPGPRATEPGSDEADRLSSRAPPELRRAERPASPDEAPPTNAAIYFRDISAVTLLSAEEEIELAQQIEIGEDARRELGARPHAPGAERRAARRSPRARRTGAQASDRGQPAAGRQRRPQVLEPRPAHAGPDPGRQYRPGARGREVRMAQGLPLQHVRLLVDPPGHDARAGRTIAADSRPDPHGLGDRRRVQGCARPAAGAWPRAARQRDCRSPRPQPRSGARDHAVGAAAGLAGNPAG